MLLFHLFTCKNISLKTGKAALFASVRTRRVDRCYFRSRSRRVSRGARRRHRPRGDRVAQSLVPAAAHNADSGVASANLTPRLGAPIFIGLFTLALCRQGALVPSTFFMFLSSRVLASRVASVFLRFHQQVFTCLRPISRSLLSLRHFAIFIEN